MNQPTIHMIHTYKCDGSLYKSLEGHYSIYEGTDSWIFFLPPLQTEQIKLLDSVQNDSGKFSRRKRHSTLTNKYPTFWFFWKEHWFNVLLTLLPDGKYNLILRISTPPIIEEKSLKYIELDLFLTLNSEKELNFLNSENYQLNSQKMKYTPNLKKEISKIIREIFQLLKNNWFDQLVSDDWINSLWEKVLISTGKYKSEFYNEANSDKRDEELNELGIAVGEIE